MVLMTVISCWWREKPIVLMSSSSSNIRCAARTSLLYKRCAGPRGKQAWRVPGSSGGRGGPSPPFSSGLDTCFLSGLYKQEFSKQKGKISGQYEAFEDCKIKHDYT